MDEQGPEGPEEEGQGRWGDVHVHGGLPPSPPLFSFGLSLYYSSP